MRINGFYVYMLILFLGYVFYDHASQLLYPGNRDKIQSGIELIATLTLLLCVIFFVKDLKSYVVVYMAVSLVFACVISVLFLKFFYDQPFHFRRKGFQEVFRYSAWQLISVSSIYLINMGTNYVLVICNISFQEIGIFNFAYRLSSGFAPFFALFGILIPKWIHSSEAGLHLVKQRLIKIFYSLAILYLGFGLTLKTLFDLFNIERYSQSIPYYFWLFPAFLLTSYSNLLNTVIANTSKFRRAQIGVLLQSGLLVIAGFPLVSAFEVRGAIAAITVASAAGALYFHLIYKKILMQTVA